MTSFVSLFNNNFIINVAAETDEFGVEYEVTGDGEMQLPNEDELEKELETLMQDERDALIALYLHTDGDSWSNSEKWLDQNEHHCMWYGISCSHHGRVVSIALAANRLNGTIPEALFDALNVLEQMDLSLNYLKEVVPTKISQLDAWNKLI